MKRILFFADASSVHTQRWVREIAARGFECVVATRRPAEVPGRSVAPHWVHGHYVTSYGLWAAASGLGPQVPVVLTAWGSDLLVTPRARGWRGSAMAALVGWSLRRAALVTADSQDVLVEVQRYGTAARCEEVVWGADTGRFEPGKSAAGFEIASLRSWEANYNLDTVCLLYTSDAADD